MHFLEHMVFMGSEKYPSENALDAFLKRHGGRDNAQTDMEHTTFYFDIQEKHFKEGLDRFAQFFINPLMKKESMKREREAVHSEFQMAQPEDTSRVQQLFASFAADGHPMSKFTYGNEETLNMGIADQELHSKLHELRKRYYSAHYMKLVLQARLTLDTMQQYVVDIFSNIPNNGLPRPCYDHLGPPFPLGKLHRLCKIVPMKEYHSLEISWTLPSLLKQYKSKPLHYISHLLGHEGRGSILSYLKKRVWAVGLYSGNDESGFEQNQCYSIMNITVELTDLGFSNIEKVLQVIFQYLAMLREVGPVERIFKEVQKMEQLDFEYAEEMNPLENVENLAEDMILYEPKDYLTGGSLLEEYNPELIRECLGELMPEKCNIMLSSKSYDVDGICNQTEKWFGTKYKLEDIPEEWETSWKNLDTNPELFLPVPNQFIPECFDLLPEGANAEYPVNICTDLWGQLWYRQDQKFKLPRGYCYLYLLTGLIQQSPKMAAMLDLFINLYSQYVMEDIYPACMAQYGYKVYATERGIIIKAHGFDNKLLKVVELLLQHIKDFAKHHDGKTFDEIKFQLLKSYHNTILKPGNVRKDTRLLILQKEHWTAADKLKALQSITPKDLLEEFAARLIPSCHARMLVQGNLKASEAQTFYNLVKAMKGKHNNQDLLPFPELQANEMPESCWIARVQGINQADSNSSVINYYQYGPGKLEQEILNEFVLMIMDEPVFDILRTREQLGYNVYCTNRNTFGIFGISITVNNQANKFSVCHVDRRIEAFLEEFIAKFESLTEEDISGYKETLTSMKETVDHTLREEMDRNWAEITCGEYLFSRLQKQIELIKNITRTSAVEWLKTLVGPKRRKLSVQVVGAKCPEEGTVPTLQDTLGPGSSMELLGPDNTEDEVPASCFIKDILDFKSKLKVFPVTKVIE
ncbi:nardilysin-like isoform X2 [Oratosquilla oratoria]